VAKKGEKRPIFEGNMHPKKMYPQYWRHNRNPVNDGGLVECTDDSLTTGLSRSKFAS
jgi:hypothetical protein